MRVLVAVALGLAAWAGGVPGIAVAEEDEKSLVAILTSEDAPERNRAYRVLSGNVTPTIVPLLLKALPASPTMGQYYGVMLIGRQPHKLKRDALRKLTRTKSPHLRILAGAALHRLGDRNATAVIVKALHTEVETATLSMMIARLYSLRDPQIQEAVRAFLHADAPTPVIEAAIYNVYLSRDSGAKPGLVALCKHENAGVRMVAAGALLVLGDAGQVEALTEALTSGEVTFSPLYKLKTFLGQARPAPPAVLAAAHEQLEEESNVSTLRVLVEILADHGYAKAVPAIRKFLDHEDALLSKAAFAALTRFPGALTPESMRGLLQGGNDARKLVAADALRRTDDTSGLTAVIEVLRTGEGYRDRSEAAQVLGRFRDPRAVDALLDGLLDSNRMVRSSAYSGLSLILRTLFPYRRLDLSTTGYTSSAPEAKRNGAAKTLRSWWETHRGGDW